MYKEKPSASSMDKLISDFVGETDSKCALQYSLLMDKAKADSAPTSEDLKIFSV